MKYDFGFALEKPVDEDAKAIITCKITDENYKNLVALIPDIEKAIEDLINDVNHRASPTDLPHVETETETEIVTLPIHQVSGTDEKLTFGQFDDPVTKTDAQGFSPVAWSDDQEQDAFPSLPDTWYEEATDAKKVKPNGTKEDEKSDTKEVKPPRAKEVKPPRAKDVKPPRAKDVKPSDTKEVKPPRAKEVKPPRAKEVKPSDTKEVKPSDAKEVEVTKEIETSSVTRLNAEMTKRFSDRFITYDKQGLPRRAMYDLHIDAIRSRACKRLPTKIRIVLGIRPEGTMGDGIVLHEKLVEKLAIKAMVVAPVLPEYWDPSEDYTVPVVQFCEYSNDRRDGFVIEIDVKKFYDTYVQNLDGNELDLDMEFVDEEETIQVNPTKEFQHIISSNMSEGFVIHRDCLIRCRDNNSGLLFIPLQNTVSMICLMSYKYIIGIAKLRQLRYKVQRFPAAMPAGFEQIVACSYAEIPQEFYQ